MFIIIVIDITMARLRQIVGGYKKNFILKKKFAK